MALLLTEKQTFLKEGDNICEYNSTIVITETTFIIKTGGKNCTPDNKDIVYDWKENTTNYHPSFLKSKDIDLLQNGTVIKTLKQFTLFDSGKKVEYNIDIKNLKDHDIDTYYFTLTKM